MTKHALLLALVFIASFFSKYGYTQTEGKQVYQTCIACHGTNGEGNSNLKSPALAGQFDWYLERQINNFKSGLRGSHTKDQLGKQMLPMVSSLSEAQIKAVSQYLSSLPKPSVAKVTSGDMMNGSRYYQAKCGACHSGAAEGNPAFNAPNLQGLEHDYIQRQMANFSQGIRGYDKKDKLGRQMAMMAKMSSGKELNDILHYINSQSK